MSAVQGPADEVGSGSDDAPGARRRLGSGPLDGFAPTVVKVPPVITGMGEVVERDTSFAEHSHPTHELLWNEHGASTVTSGSRTWTVTPTLGLWLPAGTVHSGTAPAGTWYRATHFRVRAVPVLSRGPVAVEVTPMLRLLLARLEEDLSPGSRALTEAMVVDVLEPAERELLVHEPQSTLLQPVVDALRADPGDPRGLTEWAAALGVSPRTVTRTFLAETGMAFTRWVLAFRAQHAIALLSAGWSVEDVADEVGYASASAFGVAFRRATGITPGAVRAAVEGSQGPFDLSDPRQSAS